ncbi:uncharacterized protein [Epargyreus clarus]|uniref:uncharacterized protein n=1 Tax=Epargyreus clarus TaxID=520877 RepID=UPI003C2B5977
MELRPIQFKPYKWLDDAAIFNKRDQRVPIDWIKENANSIALLFTAKGIDKDEIITKFYEMYENVKFVNLPLEVIYIPMDESEEDMIGSYDQQANWFTLKFHDPLVHILKFMYGVTCIPNILVIDPSCNIISYTGVSDLERHGKNAIITWMTDTKSKLRKFNKETEMYGEKWNYLDRGERRESKVDYQRKFSTA